MHTSIDSSGQTESPPPPRGGPVGASGGGVGVPGGPGIGTGVIVLRLVAVPATGGGVRGPGRGGRPRPGAPTGEGTGGLRQGRKLRGGGRREGPVSNRSDEVVLRSSAQPFTGSASPLGRVLAVQLPSTRSSITQAGGTWGGGASLGSSTGRGPQRLCGKARIKETGSIECSVVVGSSTRCLRDPAGSSPPRRPGALEVGSWGTPLGVCLGAPPGGAERPHSRPCPPPHPCFTLSGRIPGMDPKRRRVGREL